MKISITKTKIINVKIFVFILLSITFKCFSQWSNNSAVNNAICAAQDGQFYPNVVSDNNGGAIITWSDHRSTSSYDIYAQRINALGVTQWADDGILICSAVDSQNYPTIIADGTGGAIITWQDKRNGVDDDIYTQRINALGQIQWISNGVAICTAIDLQNKPIIVSDGSGGAIITWQDKRNGLDDNIYAQRINSSGQIQWTYDGVAICTVADYQNHLSIVSDGYNGAIITWHDHRSGVDDDIYSQRINLLGIVQWITDGIIVCSAPSYQVNPNAISDNNGGVIISWEDHRVGTESDIYAQRVDANGIIQWVNNGLVICSAQNDQYSPTIISDNNGGAIITWYDYRSNTNDDIYSQRLNNLGLTQWINDGVAICVASNDQYYPTISSDTNGGAIVTWQDFRNGFLSDIYAQFINGTGLTQWSNNGVVICSAINSQISPVIVSDNAGGAIIAWQDERSATGDDIYAQHVNSGGGINAGIKSVVDNSFIRVYPNPTIKAVTLVSDKKITNVLVYDFIGKLVHIENANTFETIIDMTDLTTGFYIFTITMSDETQAIIKVAKE